MEQGKNIIIYDASLQDYTIRYTSLYVAALILFNVVVMARFVVIPFIKTHFGGQAVLVDRITLFNEKTF